MRKSIVILFLLTVFIPSYGQSDSLKVNKAESKILFYLVDCSDTIVASTYGYIYQIVNDTLIPLSDVTFYYYITKVDSDFIKFDNIILPYDMKYTAVSDSDGSFSVTVPMVLTYDIIITKKNYQSIFIKDYIPICDEVRQMRILLEKSSGVKIYDFKILPEKYFNIYDNENY